MAAIEETAVYNISWVTFDDFDVKKVSLVELPSKDLSSRSKLLYNYNPNSPPKDLVLTVPRIPDAYIECRGVQKNTFTKGEVKVETNRYVAPLILKSDNPYHIQLYKIFQTLQDKIQRETGATNIIFPFRDVQDKYSIVYANLIHSHDGKMYSSAYTKDEQLNIIDVKKSIVRPALLISIIRKSQIEYKIQVQISQMYVHEELKDFPLAVRD